MLNKIAVTAVPIVAVLVLGSVLWQTGGTPSPDHLCALTEDNAEGPYYVEGSPTKEMLGTLLDGEKLIISGSVLDYNCNPVPGAIVDVWQTDAAGKYYSEDFTLRGKVHADENGKYVLETIFPGKYSESGVFRPAHLHVKILSPEGGSYLTTQLYFANDEHHDWLVKPSLVLELTQMNGIQYGEFDFVITP